ncbi:poly(U)-specific endoribonuclease homolog isoform X2 [Nilaparvata lugens]|uniref:poly(U)-specific endoribonuclease homolog isoform X2 n=1 Tax=Nilaparvata lugens TaxID=108931 RepID=UPI000B984D68|nr:poly(U)-specific endoribonuclease homolog isoform X2 [Nilaparvata lugens]
MRNNLQFCFLFSCIILMLYKGNAAQQGSVDSKYTTCSSENTFDHITNDDIRSFTEELLKKDNSSLFQYFKYNIQGKANKNPDVDEAPEHLLEVDDQALQYPTVEKVIALLDNYYPDAKTAEDVTEEEQVEENEFLDAIMDTAVMNHTIDFLRQKGVFDGDREMFKNWLHLMWFSLYTRGYKRLSSSGFEHVFKGEVKKNTVLGMHNWISYTLEERANHTNYYGWMKNKEFEKGSILTLRFKWNDKMKKIGSFFIGTSPEFEMALYSMCFILRNNKKCKFHLNGSKLFVRTYSICNKDNKRVVGSVYAGN